MNRCATVQFLHEWVGCRAGLRWGEVVVVVRSEVRQGLGEEVCESYDDDNYSQEVGEDSSKVNKSVLLLLLLAVKIAQKREFCRFFTPPTFVVKMEGETDGVGGSSRLRVRSLVVCRVLMVFRSRDGEW